ncbi:MULTISPECIES: tripartite tricarboxylate transporter TctB family protein [Chelativorans]|jgi:putative tricarboxylic transport membrane protein|uniref:Putative tricarboxylic transport membrane protein n=1 Tax=Chelativorans sp. (strain BNC1) TaxID=266779 RepID=Q11D40_CHESB|nr:MULTISPECIES: tripartite tricarboxylate transporter TctB family protein [Chelativorans]
MSLGGGSGAGRRPDWAALAIAAALAMVAGVIVWSTAGGTSGGGYARIGPAAFPYVIAAGLFLLAIWTAIAAWRGDFPKREPQQLGPLAWIVGGLIAQMLLLTTAGFSIATGILFAATARGLGRGPLWLTVPVGIVLAFVVWLIFARLLQLSLPAGPLERLF